MGLYKLFSYNVEIQYKSCFLSKAMLFTLITTLLNILLPFIIAYRSRGFWLKSHNFYEQPTVYFTYEYILVAETEDPSQPIVCSEAAILYNDVIGDEGNCAEIQVQEYDYNRDDKNDILDFSFKLNIPTGRMITSVILIIALDFQLKTVCPLHMQSLAVINKEFSVPPSELIHYCDLSLYQVSHLPCFKDLVDINYNNSLLTHKKQRNTNLVEFILEEYFNRDVTTQINTIHSRSQHGHTGNMHIKVRIRIPEVQVRYVPTLLQELKWAWPQYLSIVIVFYWIFDKIKRFVFNNRLLMAWEIVPWKRN